MDKRNSGESSNTATETQPRHSAVTISPRGLRASSGPERGSRSPRAAGARPVSRRTRGSEYVPSSRRISRATPRMSVTMPHAFPVVGDDDSWLTIAKQEIHVFFGFFAGIFMMIYGDHDTYSHDIGTGLFIVFFCWAFLQAIWLAFGVVRHADCLAVQLGEPYGTLILTLSVISIEVIMMAALMITGDEPTLARDTMFAVIMIVLNGMLGVTLVMGGRKHSQQSYNFNSSQSFLNVLLPLAILSMIVPRFTTSAPNGEVSDVHAGFLVFESLALYATFLIVQTMRHPDFFMAPEAEEESAPRAPVAGVISPAELADITDLEASASRFDTKQKSDSGDYPAVERASGSDLSQYNMEEQLKEMHTQNQRLTRHVTFLTREFISFREHSRTGSLMLPEDASFPPASSPMHSSPRGEDAPLVETHSEADSHAGLVLRSIKFHVVFLLLSMIPISLLAENLSALIERVVTEASAPNALTGFFVAVIVLAPEGMGAARAAIHNKVQRTVNIALGSALSTIGLTIPAVMTIRLISGKTVELGLTLVGCVELLLSLMVTMVTFSNTSTNLLHGAVHACLFASYVMLMFIEDNKDGSGSGSHATFMPSIAPSGP